MRIRRRVAQHRHQLQHSFARLWVGFSFSSSGDGLIYGAVPLMAVVVDPSPLAVSAVAAADSLPWLLLALPAGAFADKFDQGPMMALANTFRAGVILLAALLIMSDRMTLVILILVVLLNAGARAVYYSSFQAMVPALVDSDSLEHANGLLTGTESGAEHLAGPIVGTWLFAVSKAIPFLADAIASRCLRSRSSSSVQRRSPNRRNLRVSGRARSSFLPIPACVSYLRWSAAWPDSREWKPASWCSWRPQNGEFDLVPTASSSPLLHSATSLGVLWPTASSSGSAVLGRSLAPRLHPVSDT